MQEEQKTSGKREVEGVYKGERYHLQLTTLHSYPHLAQAVRVIRLANYTRVKAARWHLSTEVKRGLHVIMPGSC